LVCTFAELASFTVDTFWKYPLSTAHSEYKKSTKPTSVQMFFDLL
jgi:hypothetical protein